MPRPPEITERYENRVIDGVVVLIRIVETRYFDYYNTTLSVIGAVQESIRDIDAEIAQLQAQNVSLQEAIDSNNAKILELEELRNQAKEWYEGPKNKPI